jgi:hypothetical protein
MKKQRTINRLQGESKKQRRRRNMMTIVHNVVDVGEQVKAFQIYERLCIAYPNGHHSLPLSVNQLGQIMRAEESMEKINVGVNQNEWRRIE